MSAGAESLHTAPSEKHRAAGVAFGAHALHDGYTDLIYVMLPVWQAEFGLGYFALGLMKTAFSGTLAAFQIPASMVAERFGAPLVLALGTALAGLGYVIAGASSGIVILAAALILGGLGASTQHPLASTLIARAFSGRQSMTALGTYNFAGDIGKMAVPAIGALMLTVMPWREAVTILGSLGALAGIAIYIFMPRLGDATAAHATKAETKAVVPVRAARHGFPVLLSIGVIDSATRMGFLTFLPFVLTAKGASLPTVGFALTLVFAGGAFGKLACAFIGARLGAIGTVWLTETVTAIAIAALLPLPLEASMVLLPVIGIALNGTSSVLYGSVPQFVEPSRHQRAFGIFYTGTIGAGAAAPSLYGLLGDAAGVTTTMTVIAGAVLLTLPLAAALRGVMKTLDAA
ncbi:MAG: MFS transporter [Xanthobacteraceae bacterium]|uniref:MFS transporter n=1 Tax=Pseudolabrys sp. TaxID=1960880 RepID=UPI003D119328